MEYPYMPTSCEYGDSVSIGIVGYGGYSEGSSSSLGAFLSYGGILIGLFWFYGGHCEYTGDTQRALLALWGPS